MAQLWKRVLRLVGLIAVTVVVRGPSLAADQPTTDFPPELVEFVPYGSAPLLAGTGQDTWDRKIRERGFILREGDAWHLWYTGYNEARSDSRFLGYATSNDGLHWTRWPGNPLTTQGWVEGVQVVKQGDTYYGYYHALPASGAWNTCVAVSDDLIHWRKYPRNPLVEGDKSSGIVVDDGQQYRLYTMHPDVRVYFPRGEANKSPTTKQDQGHGKTR